MFNFNSRKLGNRDGLKRKNEDDLSNITNDFSESTEKFYPKAKTNSNQTIVCQRKFPGPAGLLLSNNGLNVARNAGNPESEEEDSEHDQIGVYSQSSNDLFNGEPWLKMLNDFQSSDPASNLPTRYTINWLKLKARSKRLIKRKSPFLAAVISNIEHTGENHSIHLKDPTGEIQGTFDDEVWNEFSNQLKLGSVVVLRQVGVITTNFNLIRHYLNITINNIICIYVNSRENASTVPLENVEIVKGCNYLTGRDIEQNINKVKNDHKQEQIKCQKQNQYASAILINNRLGNQPPYNQIIKPVLNSCNLEFSANFQFNKPKEALRNENSPVRTISLLQEIQFHKNTSSGVSLRLSDSANEIPSSLDRIENYRNENDALANVSEGIDVDNIFEGIDASSFSEEF